MFCKFGGILGEHPDMAKVPGVEASTGSLGHGLPFMVGIALGNRSQSKTNRYFVLVGDGECHEGTIWELANLARNLELGNLCVVVDWEFNWRCSFCLMTTCPPSGKRSAGT